jgi:hypothetical protein
MTVFVGLCLWHYATINWTGWTRDLVGLFLRSRVLAARLVRLIELV